RVRPGGHRRGRRGHRGVGERRIRLRPAGRRLALAARGGPGADHPADPGAPEARLIPRAPVAPAGSPVQSGPTGGQCCIERRSQMAPRRSGWAAAAAAALTVPTAAAVGGTAEADTGWRLVHEEDFSRFAPSGDTGWFPDKDGAGGPYDVDGYDNDGGFFHAVGGPAFGGHLDGMDLYRRSFSFGEDGWLTAELARRDGVEEPSFTRDELPGAGPAGLFDSPEHGGAVVLRSTEALPAEYRVEVTLRTVDFGGQRGGEWDYDGKVNGYRPSDCKTNFPWAASGDFTRPACDWADVTTDSNGFYFLSVMDYERPAPHNNVFIHTHRKVVMDGYNRYRYTGDGLRYCDARTGELQPYEWGSGNGVNMLFMTDERRYADQPGTEYVMHSECGTEVGGGIVSQ